jgi:hypothetical protein
MPGFYFLPSLDSQNPRPIICKFHTPAAAMLVHSRLQQQSSVRLLWGGMLVVGFLCLLASWSLESSADYSVSDAGRNSRLVSVDMPLHANSEHSFTLKRFLSRYKDQPKSAEPPEPTWVLAANDVIALFPCATARSHNSAAQTPHFSLHQLQTLNISRAPPLV